MAVFRFQGIGVFPGNEERMFSSLSFHTNRGLHIPYCGFTYGNTNRGKCIEAFEIRLDTEFLGNHQVE